MGLLRRAGAIAGGIAGFAWAGSAWAQESPWGWLPPNLNPAYGDQIDYLYLVILVITGALFFLTEGLLLFSILRFRARPGRGAAYSHGNNAVEFAWSVIPAGILVWLALYQKETWAFAKQKFPTEEDAVVVQVYPEQFQWNFRYSGKDASFGTEDDLTSAIVMHVPFGRKILLKMTSKDVIHSFFLPHARVKQDVVPGMLTRAWFETNLYPCWDLSKQGSDPETFVPWEEGFTLLTAEEFAERKVAIDGFKFQPPKTVSKDGVRNYRYDPAKKSKKARILHQGVLAEGTTDDAEMVLHYVDIACAELCGLGHFRMRGKLVIDPPEVFDLWLGEAEPGPEYLKFQDLWDRDFPQFNEKVAP